MSHLSEVRPGAGGLSGREVLQTLLRSRGLCVHVSLVSRSQGGMCSRGVVTHCSRPRTRGPCASLVGGTQEPGLSEEGDTSPSPLSPSYPDFSLDFPSCEMGPIGMAEPAKACTLTPGHAKCKRVGGRKECPSPGPGLGGAAQLPSHTPDNAPTVG